jgi:hypothetical protein
LLCRPFGGAVTAKPPLFLSGDLFLWLRVAPRRCGLLAQGLPVSLTVGSGLQAYPSLTPNQKRAAGLFSYLRESV